VLLELLAFVASTVLEEPYLSPEPCMGWIGQDSSTGIELQGKIMSKAWGKLLHRLKDVHVKMFYSIYFFFNFYCWKIMI